MEINNKQDWWQAVDNNWETLIDIAFLYNVPLWEFIDIDKNLSSKTLLKNVEDCKGARDWESLHSFFQGIWGSAPDIPEIHNVKGWGLLCDLCSETWVFNDEQRTMEG